MSYRISAYQRSHDFQITVVTHFGQRHVLGANRGETIGDVRHFLQLAELKHSNESKRLDNNLVITSNLELEENDIYKFPAEPLLFLCHAESFRQFRIPFMSRSSRLFTLIGEQHLINRANCRNGVKEVSEYIRMIDDISRTNDKNFRIFIEVTPLSIDVDVNRIGSQNIQKIINYKKHVCHIDIREITPDHFYNIMNMNLRQITVDQLSQLLQSYTKIRHFFTNILKDGKELLDDMYDKSHLSYIRRLLEAADNDKQIIEQHIKEANADNIFMRSISRSLVDSEKQYQRKVEIRDNLILLYAKLTDIYVIIQIFRTDYQFDHIILLIGDNHTPHINGMLDHFRIFDANRIDDGVLDINGSFF